MPRGHPGKFRTVHVVLPAGIFTHVTDHLSIYQDSGYPLRAVVQVANPCNDIRRWNAPGCVLDIDHPGEFHANNLGEAWKVDPE